MIRQKQVTIKEASAILTLAEMGDIIVKSSDDSTITLPTGSGGLWYHIHNYGSGVVSVSDGSVMTTLEQYESAIILYNTIESVWGYTKSSIGGASFDYFARFKKSNSTFTDNDTSQTFTDSFCTAGSLVVIALLATPNGVWTVESDEGEFTITSTAAEDTDIPFDYFIIGG